MTILSLGVVSAQDNVTDDATSSSQDDAIELESNDDSKLSDDASTAYNKTVYVETAEGSDDGAGSEASPYKTISKAISDVDTSDKAVIYLGSGNYSDVNNTNLQINLDHKNNNGSLTFIGDSNGGTIIDGNNTSPIFKSIGPNSIVTFINITFTHSMSSSGSAINSNGKLTIDNCVFEENNADDRAAVYSRYGDLTVQNSKFYKNTAYGDADLYFSDGSATLINNIFESSTVTSSYADVSYSNVGKITIVGESYGNVIIDAEHAKSDGGVWAPGTNIFTFGENLEIKLVNLTLINCEGSPVEAYGLTMKDNIV